MDRAATAAAAAAAGSTGAGTAGADAHRVGPAAAAGAAGATASAASAASTAVAAGGGTTLTSSSSSTSATSSSSAFTSAAAAAGTSSSASSCAVLGASVGADEKVHQPELEVPLRDTRGQSHLRRPSIPRVHRPHLAILKSANVRRRSLTPTEARDVKGDAPRGMRRGAASQRARGDLLRRHLHVTKHAAQV